MKKVSCEFVLAILCIGYFIQWIPVHADSGWDSSYDSGGSSSWDSGSSSWGDSSSSWGDSSSSSSRVSGNSLDQSDFIECVIIVGVILGLLIFRGKGNVRRPASSSDRNSIVPYDVEKIKAILPNFDKNNFQKQTFSIYEKIQIAWMNFDYGTLRKYATDTLYNLYYTQLNVLKAKKQKNIMKNFELNDFEIVGMERIENTIALKVRMLVECMDYVVDKENKVIRGTDKQKMVYDYEMTFIKGMDTKVNKCPNCNAPQENTNSSVCPYCDSVIVSNNHDWVLAKKQMVNQYRK